MRPIPTIFRDVQFRSRLEARWAAFFDKLGWPWEYEPIDLDGYIPDFVIKAPHAPFIVEVKPAFSISELKPHATRIEASGWRGNALIVGASLFSNPSVPYLTFGLLSQHGPGDTPMWSCGSFGGACGDTEPLQVPSLYHELLFHYCYICGYHRGPGTIPHFDLAYDVQSGLVEKLWRESGNSVQWKPTR